MPLLLIALPNHDTPTQWAYHFIRPMISRAASFGWTVDFLEGPEATRRNITEQLRGNKYDLVFVLGHGTSREYSSYQNEPTIIAKENANILSGTSSFFLSCNTARELGPDVVQSGGKNYLGWFYEIVWVSRPGSSPENDDIAAQFFEVVNAMFDVILRGGSFREAKDLGNELFNRKMDEWRMKEDYLAPIVFSAFVQDRDGLRVLGDGVPVGAVPYVPVAEPVSGRLSWIAVVGVLAFFLL